jgi:hypothetical protein
MIDKSKYFFLETNYFTKPGAFRTRAINAAFGYSPSHWLMGRALKDVSQSINVQLWERGGNGLAEMFLDSIPVFRNDFVEAIKEIGVKNIQVLHAKLHDPSGAVHDNYSAVNFLDLVRAADLAKSKYDDVSGTGQTAMSFRNLIIDNEATGGLPMFRLSEAVSSIVVSHEVKAHIETKKFAYLSWRCLSDEA